MSGKQGPQPADQRAWSINSTLVYYLEDSMPCRGVRGAITVDENSESAILEATRELLDALVTANGLRPAEVASVFFTATPDLDASFPARAARQLGWADVPLLDAVEMAVPGALSCCIRAVSYTHLRAHET